MLEIRDLPLWGQPPPAPRTRDSNNPTLLFSWWCTGFSAAVIVTRLCGRKTRSNKLFREDWIMMLALIPLFIRMAFIHVVLLYGTNNVETKGEHFTELEVHHREIGSRLVLAARIFYAMFIWTCKLTISEFLKRITIRIWRRSYEVTLQGIRIFLVITFFLVVIATLSECQPFDHYWQVIPDPGPHCRQGYGNLITMGTADMITDILLVAFPIPIIVKSGQTWKRKLQLSSLFSLSVILIAITATRVPMVINLRGRQQYRTVWASAEILAAAAVSNGVIIGSFLRDKGTKKNRYRANSVSDSIERSSTRRPTVTALQNTGSEEDLFRFLGIRVPEHLQDRDEDDDRPRLAPAALPATPLNKSRQVSSHSPDSQPKEPGETNSSDSDDSLRKQHVPEPVAPSPVPSSRRAANFFDVGGLLETGTDSPATRSQVSTLVGQGHDGTTAHDFATPTPSQSRRGSRAFLQDVGGLLTPTSSRLSNNTDRLSGRRQSDSHLNPPSRHNRTAPTGILGPMLERRETQQSLQDPGGLLAEIPESPTWRRALSEVHELQPRISLQRPEDGNNSSQGPNFQDLGDLMSGSHEPDASAAALLRVTGRQSRRRSVQHVMQSTPASAPSRGWEGMDIEDPGGLLRR